MGIQGLIQFINAATEESNILKLQGKTVAIDSYWLMHKGSYCCSEKLVRGIKTTAMIDYAMKYVRMLQSYCANIIMVFDGKSLPAKQNTDAKRREGRQLAKSKAIELAKSGKYDEAKREFDKAVTITHQHALELMEECRRSNIDCIVAAYEADAQLAYLNKIGLADYIISEDSDLILFGCTNIVFKLKLDGKCVIFDSKKLPQTIPNYTFEKFRRICILSGCDYLNNLPGIGLLKAKKFFTMTAETDMNKALLKIPAYLNLKISVPSDYIENFLRAEATFKYMYVYDPLKRAMVRLNDLTDEEDEKYCVNAGELLSPNIAYQLALGNINPKTMEKASNYDPSKGNCVPAKSAQTVNTKYRPLFNIWKYEGKHEETIVKVKQQSRITFVPMKFKQPEVMKIAEEENDVEDAIEMDNLISAYSGTPSGIKRPSSVLNDEDGPSASKNSPKNPFAKRQSLERNAEKADNCSLIKVLSAKESNYAESRVVSRFFSSKANKELETNPLEIIERIETAKMEREAEIENRLELNEKFYSSEKSLLETVAEKYSNKTTQSDESSNSDATSASSSSQQSHSSQEEIKEISTQYTFKQLSKSKVQSRVQSKTVKSKISTSALTAQHKLSKFGFTKTKQIL